MMHVPIESDEHLDLQHHQSTSHLTHSSLERKKSSKMRARSLRSVHPPLAHDVQLGRDRLYADPDTFRTAFAPWRDYSIEGWSEGKHLRRGTECDVHFILDNGTMEVCFVDDEQNMILPVATVSEQISVLGRKERARILDLNLLRRQIAQFDSEKSIDTFDLAALEPNANARLFTDNCTRAVICFLLQVFAPLVVGAYLMYSLLSSEAKDGAQWTELCRLNTGWNDAVVKVLNRLLGATLLVYMYNFMESREYDLLDKPTFELLEIGKTFDVFPRPAWLVVGFVCNILALANCGIVSIIVVYVSENPLDLLLNALALFFLVDVDNSLCDTHDFERNRALLRGALRAYEQNESEVLIKKSYNVRRFAQFGNILLQVVKMLVLISPLYILACK